MAPLNHSQTKKTQNRIWTRAALYLIPLTFILTGVTYSALNKPRSSEARPMTQAILPTGVIEPSRDAVSIPVKERPPAGLYTQTPERQAFTLTHTDVKGKVDGNIARVSVTQKFTNPFDKPLEAVYVFPLPDEAAVDDLEIKIGDRIIKGNIKRREEAKAAYEQARQEGRTAALLEQERDNIFTQSLANIRPKETIEVTIRYTDSLKFEAGNYEFVFPMVVGPRYISRRPENRISDANRITPPLTPPETRSGQDISVDLRIDAGVPIQRLVSTSHRLVLATEGNTAAVKIAPDDNIPNKDLVVRYQVSNNREQSTILTTNSPQGGHFATYVIPAVTYRPNEIVPKDVVFLMDTSGSQSGDPLVKSQELMRRFIAGLNPDDTFTIIDFANTATYLSPVPLRNNEINRRLAYDYINRLNANGGTELMNGINAVMKFPPAPDGRIRSVVLITDGYIGNDQQVIAEVQKQLKKGNRLYAFGVGSSVNRYLLNRLAEVGRGTVQVVRQDEPTAEVAEKFFRQINQPVLINVKVTWEGEGPAPEIYPQIMPDLFAQQPLVIYGRKEDRASGTLRITGQMANGERYEQRLPVNFKDDSAGNNLGIAQLWGRAKIKDLSNQILAMESKSIVELITKTALDYRLLSAYTAFIAISEEVRVNPNGERIRVQVPVELPQGVRYDGIMGGTTAESVQRTTGLAAPAPLPMAPRPYIANQQPSSSGDVTGNSNAAAPSGRSAPRMRGTNQPTSTQSSVADKKDAALAPTTLRVTKVSGNLNSAELAALQAKLNADLQQSPLSGNYRNLRGKVAFDLTLVNGSVTQVIWDDTASDLKDNNLLQELRTWLLNWQEGSSNGKLQVIIEVN
jgi:Ca-activated chloride channel family protein